MLKRNFFLGRGERLPEDVTTMSGHKESEISRSFREAQMRLAPMLDRAVEDLSKLPDDACPGGKAVISFALDPERVAESRFPGRLLESVGISVVGSRSKRVKSDRHSRDREPTEIVTTELFAHGSRSAIRKWGEALPNWQPTTRGADELVHVDQVSAPAPHTKVKGIPPSDKVLLMEVVLHCHEHDGEIGLLNDFGGFLRARGLANDFGRRFHAKGLCFIQLEAPAESAEEIATFSNVRTLRKMPELRPPRPMARSTGNPVTKRALPNLPSISKGTRMAIFDGGLPENHPLRKWTTLYEFDGMSPATLEQLEHGTEVTSAALFGHIDPNRRIPCPFANVDHYRALDMKSDRDPRGTYEVLDRIDYVLSTRDYDFVNLSVGPELPVEDDEVHAWTAVLDERFAQASTLAVLAVDDRGELDSTADLDRIQAPSDCMNALAVGACGTARQKRESLPCSSSGPGRSPGTIKPDLVAFGGSTAIPFVATGHDLDSALVETGGTSLAAASVLRMASGMQAHFGKKINQLSIRALLVHTAETGDIDPHEAVWGRCAQDLNDVVTCSDDEVRFVYQGEVSPAKYIRARIPTPAGQLKGTVSLKATICFKSSTDPRHPGSHARAGLDVTFRPHEGRFKHEKQRHPDSKGFFGSSRPGATEDESSRDVTKRANCLRATKKMYGPSLCNPAFDIHYNSRPGVRNVSTGHKLPYALIVSVRAKNVANLYDQDVQNFGNQLEPLLPVHDTQQELDD